MPEYLEDPSVLTKDRLKSELLAHNVELPGGNPNKDVYVQLYLKNLTVQNQKHQPNSSLDAFSSDEELPPVLDSSKSRSSGRKPIKKAQKIELEELDVTALTDSGLRDELLKHGVVVGPIVASTRKLYEKKLQQFLRDGDGSGSGSGGAQQHPADVQVNQNGTTEPDVYSDQEEDVAPEPEPEPEPEPQPKPEVAPTVERAVRSRGKTQHQTVEKIAASDQTPKPLEDDAFANDANSPSGFTVVCRRPIRRAAGLPVTSGDLWTVEDRVLPRETTETSSVSYTERQSVNRVSTPPLSSLPPSIPPPSIPPPSIPSPSTSHLWTPSPPSSTSERCSRSMWVKLALLGAVVVFLFLVYVTMEPSSTGLFGK